MRIMSMSCMAKCVFAERQRFPIGGLIVLLQIYKYDEGQYDRVLVLLHILRCSILTHALMQDRIRLFRGPAHGSERLTSPYVRDTTRG